MTIYYEEEEMKTYTLKEQYELSLKSLSLVMPISSLFLIIIGICILPIKTVWWGGLILIGIGGLVLLECYFICKFIKKKIKELEDER